MGWLYNDHLTNLSSTGTELANWNWAWQYFLAVFSDQRRISQKLGFVGEVFCLQTMQTQIDWIKAEKKLFKLARVATLKLVPEIYFWSLDKIKQLRYCQAQFQLASQASVTLELRLALLSLWVHPPIHPSTHPPGQVYLSIVEQGRETVFGRKALGWVFSGV